MDRKRDLPDEEEYFINDEEDEGVDSLLYPSNQMDDGLRPRCTPRDMAGIGYSFYPANLDIDEDELSD